MTPDDYVKLAVRTEAPPEKALARLMGYTDPGASIFPAPRPDRPNLTRLLHATEGMTTEVGELTDTLKKHVFYGKPYDTKNAFEEVGDLMWYVALFCDAHGFSLQDVMEANIRKLKERFKEKFTENEALMRNKEAEMGALSGPVAPPATQG